jgi:serine/threonine protein kinase
MSDTRLDLDAEFAEFDNFSSGKDSDNAKMRLGSSKLSFKRNLSQRGGGISGLDDALAELDDLIDPMSDMRTHPSGASESTSKRRNARKFASRSETRTSGEPKLPEVLRDLEDVGLFVDNDYTIVAKVGQGEFGNVYKARDNANGNTVAIKVVYGGKGGVIDSAALIESRREFEISRLVTSPNVVHYQRFMLVQPARVIDATGRDACFVLIMDFLEGTELTFWYKRIQTTYAMPRQTVVVTKLARDMATGLVALHSADVVHSDIRTSNVMVQGSGRVEGTAVDVRAVLVDIGISCVTIADAKYDCSTTYVYTPGYASPEKALGGIGGDWDPKADDCWALGVVLYELVMGKHPFPNLLTADPVKKPKIFLSVIGAKPITASGTDPKVLRAIELLLVPEAERISAEDILATLIGGRLSSDPYKLEDFLLKKELGNGAFGTVFLAMDKKSGNHVALKVLTKQSNKDLERAEVAIAQGIRSRHVVRYLGYISNNPPVQLKAAKMYVASAVIMNYVDGQELTKFMGLARDNKNDVYKIVKGLATGVAALHAECVAHRDIKPPNIMLIGAAKNTAVLIDLGLGCRACAGCSVATKCMATGQASICTVDPKSGTAAYNGPEKLETMVRAAKKLEMETSYADMANDMWSVGLILFRLLVGDTNNQKFPDFGNTFDHLPLFQKYSSQFKDQIPDDVDPRLVSVVRGLLVPEQDRLTARQVLNLLK